MPTPNTQNPFSLTFVADVRNPRTFTATEGANSGKTYYTADAELPCSGQRWSSFRLKVRSRAPITEGRYNISLVSLDSGKCEGVADLGDKV